jgi:23S rRNA pseudouridine2605 synthase
LAPVRIQKYLAEQGLASRREAERLLVAGKIKINGRIVRTLGTAIEPGKDSVEIIGADAEKKRSALVYKPRGLMSSEEESRKTVFDLSPEFEGLHPAGRLDKESEGLIILTNDGTLARILTGSDHLLQKEYEVEVREPVKPFMVRAFERGIELEEGKTLPTEAEIVGTRKFRIVLREGKKHQIRRMAAVFRLTVTRLIRTRIGPVKIGSLRPGQFRFLTEKEILDLKKTGE